MGLLNKEAFTLRGIESPVTYGEFLNTAFSFVLLSALLGWIIAKYRMNRH